MVDLISKASRDEIGLTSWWRAIVWSAISLKASISNPAAIDSIPNYGYANAVRIALGRSVSDGALGAALTIEATLPYAKSEGINAAGQFIPYLKEFYSGLSVLYSQNSCADLVDDGYTVSGEGNGLPDEPSYVDTLEKYFLWVCWEGERELLDPLPSKLLPITIDFFEESTPDPTIKVKAIIPIDYAAYKASQNFVCSVLDPGFQLSPAGLRSFSWVEIINKPNFHPVATSGDYGDLENTPSIPSDVSELEGFNALIRSINGDGPDPETGNIDLTLNATSIEWGNVQAKPSFHPVAVSGNYDDLSNKPSIPTNVNQLSGYSSLVRSINGNTPNGGTGDVTLTVTSDWSGIQNKPNFHPVAFSGNYDDLSNKPTIPSGGGGTGNVTLLGKKTIYGGTSNVLPWSSNGDNNGVVRFLGTNNGSQAFSNPYTSGAIGILNNGGVVGTFTALVDQVTTSFPGIGSTGINLVFDFKNYGLKPSRIIINASTGASSNNSLYQVKGSNDNTNWTVLGSLTVVGTTITWYTVQPVTNDYYRYISLNYISHTGSTASIQFREIEFYGEFLNTNVADGSLVSQISVNDLGYSLFPDIKVGSFVLPDLTGVSIGQSFYIYNPHAFSLAVNPTVGQTLIKANGFNTIDQGKLAFCFALSATEWIMF